ncbi:CCA tRNA nucleotidyltransferase 1, mitochondrial [Atheta coriaria]|uniref:CCA tRNA nucleotidyltransferase 1, mitochondrial n=1 Tax=Dalotia coriaria TaxID=877792 RepID=UPI0031F35A60
MLGALLTKVMLLLRIVTRSIFNNRIVSYSTSIFQQNLLKFRKMAPKHRENPIIKKLDSSEFKSIFTDELLKLSTIFDKYGYEIRIAGGAVRDLLSGKTPKDLDFATTATPDQMKTMFTEENIRMINAKGEKHGTITPRINDKENFEVTTLRIDVLTDGRHAEVQYTTDWLLDANRRDLTINSMFLDLNGNIYDYFYGYDDLQKRRVAFVGNPVTRIQEDFLRILRYFRFYGRIASTPDDHDEVTITAIKENASGLAQISGERIWTELKKILEGNFSGELLKKILECNCAPHIGLPENYNLKELDKILMNLKTNDLQLNAITLLTSLINTEEEAMQLHARIKFSAYERDLMLFIVQHREPKLDPRPLQPYKILVLKAKNKNTREYVVELLKYLNSEHIEEFNSWVLPKFPLNGTILKENGVEAGNFMGAVMQAMKNYWTDNDFNLSEEELLKKLPSVVAELKEKSAAKRKISK